MKPVRAAMGGVAVLSVILRYVYSIAQPAEPAIIQVVDIAAKAGVRFVLLDGSTPERHQIEPMVGGVAVFDFNNDGRPDIYFVNGARQPLLNKPDPSYYNRVYRNDGNFTFTDVTDEAGVRGDGFTTGVAAGDYDNDGFVDLFIAGAQRAQRTESDVGCCIWKNKKPLRPPRPRRLGGEFFLFGSGFIE